MLAIKVDREYLIAEIVKMAKEHDDFSNELRVALLEETKIGTAVEERFEEDFFNEDLSEEEISTDEAIPTDEAVPTEEAHFEAASAGKDGGIVHPVPSNDDCAMEDAPPVSQHIDSPPGDIIVKCVYHYFIY